MSRVKSGQRKLSRRGLQQIHFASITAGGLLATMVPAAVAHAQTPVSGYYLDNLNGSSLFGWSSSPLWQNGVVPGNAGDIATFGGSATGQQTVSVDLNNTSADGGAVGAIIGTMNFSNSNTTDGISSWLVASTSNSLIFDNKGLGASLSYSATSPGHDDVSITAPIYLNDNLTISNGQLPSQHSIYFTGNISNSTNASMITIGGNGIVSLNAADRTGNFSDYIGSWVVAGGTGSSTAMPILRIGDDYNLGTGTNKITLQGNVAQLRYDVTTGTNINVDFDRQIFLNAATNIIDVGPTTVVNYNNGGNLIGTQGVTFADAGTTNINAAQTSLTGLWNVTGGTLVLNDTFNGAMAVSNAHLTLNAPNSFSSLTFNNAVLEYNVTGAAGGRTLSTGTSLIAISLGDIPGQGDSIVVNPNTALIIQSGLSPIDVSLPANHIAVNAGAIIAETQSGAISNNVTGLPQGVFFGVVGDINDTVAVGGTNSFAGLSSTALGAGNLKSTLSAGGDFLLQGIAVNGGAGALLLGDAGAPLVISSTTGSPVNATIAQGTVQTVNAGNDFSGINNLFVGDGTNAATLQTANIVNAFTGLQGAIIVNNQGTLDPGSTSTTGGAINVATHLLAGSQLLLNDANNLNGTSTISIDPGAAITISDANALGTQPLAISPGAIVRLGVNNFTGEQALINANPGAVYVLGAGGSPTNLTSFALNGGGLANDGTARTLNLAAGVPISVGSNGATFVGTGAALVINAPVLAAGQTLTIGATNVVDAAAGGAKLAGNGSVVFNSAVTAANLNQVSGGLTFSAASVGTITGNVNVAPSSTLTVASTSTFNAGSLSGAGSLGVADGSRVALSASTIGVGSNSGTVNSIGALNLNNSGALDISNNALTIGVTTPIATIRQYLTTGYSNGNWNGTSGGGITSTWAANDATHRTAVGYAAQPDGTTLVAATLYGDTTLKGSVGLSDYNTLAANFNKPGVWAQGDFDYDGTVTLADYNKLATNFNKSAQPGGGVAASGAAAPASVKLSGSASPAASVLPDGVVDPGAGNVVLEANPSTGQLYLVGHDSNINSYEVDSAAGKLTFVSQKNHGGYNTLTAQSGSTGLPGSALGQNEDIWATISSAAGTFVAEAYPAGSNPAFDTFGPGLQVFDLNVSGLSAWTAGTPISDLTFKYGNGTGNTLTPAVIPIGVPEPTCLALAGIAAGGLLGRRRRRELR